MPPEDFVHYPRPVRMPDAPYANPAPSNPTLSGTVLTVLSHV